MTKSAPVSQTLFVKPAHPDLIVRDPVTMISLPAEGAEVERNSYWLRRITDGDVVEVKTEKPSKLKVPKNQTQGPVALPNGE